MNTALSYSVVLTRETDGRWIAEVQGLLAAPVYGGTRKEAIARANTLTLRVVAERIEHGELSAASALSVNLTPVDEVPA